MAGVLVRRDPERDKRMAEASRWRPRLERRAYQQVAQTFPATPGAGKGKEASSRENFRGTLALLTHGFPALTSRAVRMISVASMHPVSHVSLRQPQEMNAGRSTKRAQHLLPKSSHAKKMMKLPEGHGCPSSQVSPDTTEIKNCNFFPSKHWG